MYVADMSIAEAEEWLKAADDEGLTENDVQDLKDRIAGRK